MVTPYKSSVPRSRSISTTLAVLGVLASLAALLFIKYYARDIAASYAEDSLNEYNAFKDQIERSSPPILLEGLPHPASEADLYLVESLRPDISSFRGHYESDALNLYTTPLPLGDLEAMQLTNIITNSHSIALNASAKACGPFHADYALRFDQFEARPIHVFICFSCSEVQFTGSLPTLSCELSENATTELKAILTSKVQNRPNPAHKSFFEQAVEMNERSPQY
ncbi:hypothetical protein VDG1235_4240 [Verrucomicrobiia bacterium DG1235]|nr:hypothetical protein VDG1235_4240 [Verrucomicrobiae bacterium DG1235]